MATVLVLKDDLATSQVIENVLDAEGHTVLVVRRGLDAMTLLNGHGLLRPDLLLIDGATRASEQIVDTLRRDRSHATPVLVIGGCTDSISQTSTAPNESSVVREMIDVAALRQLVRETLVQTRPLRSVA